MRKIIGLVDCNNFFVSCERTQDRSLEGKAVVVLSNNDGCAVARSNEAKRLGVKMGQPAFELKDLVRSGQLITLSGNHLLYRRISLQVHAIFRRFAPSTIDYSIDEAFLDMTGIPLDALESIGEAIVEACWQEAGIPVTVGFSYSKTLAKLATESGKKSGRRVALLFDDNRRQEILQSLPVSELWGVGRRLTKRLYESGIYTILDFANRDIHWVRAKMGVTGERSWRELHGESCIELDHVDRLLQDSVSESRTFPEDIDDYDYIRARIAIYSADCAKKLRAMKGVCHQVAVMLQTNRFRNPEVVAPQSPYAAAELPHYTCDTTMIVDAAIALLDNIFAEGVPYKRAGVILSDIRPDVPQTPSLFDPIEEEDHPDSKRLMKALDKINLGVGGGVIKLASQITKGHPGHNDGYSSSFGAPK